LPFLKNLVALPCET